MGNERTHTEGWRSLNLAAALPLCCAACRSGQGIIALNQSANRDEDVFEDPDRFDIK